MTPAGKRQTDAAHDAPDRQSRPGLALALRDTGGLSALAAVWLEPCRFG
jgi:hypothetical protein